MSKFIQVMHAEKPCYVNVDLVRTITPTNFGSVLHFDDEHSLTISTKLDEFMAAVERVTVR